MIAVNHASAVALGGDSEAALSLLSRWQDDPQLKDYQPYFVALGFVYGQLGQRQRAGKAYRRAIDLTQEQAERIYLTRLYNEFTSEQSTKETDL